MSFCLHVSSSSSFLSLARTIVRTLVCTHTRARILLTTRFRWPRLLQLVHQLSLFTWFFFIGDHTDEKCVSSLSFSSVSFACLASFPGRITGDAWVWSRGPGQIHRRLVNEAGDVSEDMEMGRHFHLPALLFSKTGANGTRRTCASVPFLLFSSKTLVYSIGRWRLTAFQPMSTPATSPGSLRHPPGPPQHLPGPHSSSGPSLPSTSPYFSSTSSCTTCQPSTGSLTYLFLQHTSATLFLVPLHQPSAFLLLNRHLLLHPRHSHSAARYPNAKRHLLLHLMTPIGMIGISPHPDWNGSSSTNTPPPATPSPPTDIASQLVTLSTIPAAAATPSPAAKPPIHESDSHWDANVLHGHQLFRAIQPTQWSRRPGLPASPFSMCTLGYLPIMALRC